LVRVNASAAGAMKAAAPPTTALRDSLNYTWPTAGLRSWRRDKEKSYNLVIIIILVDMVTDGTK
jgi:hypothetical protein